jgi:hypothetical protein
LLLDGRRGGENSLWWLPPAATCVETGVWALVSRDGAGLKVCESKSEISHGDHFC